MDEPLKSDLTAGLSAAVAAARLQEVGPNELETEAVVSAWQRFVAQFRDALVILLVVAAVISAIVWVMERESFLPYEAIVIVAVVLLNALMGFIQEGRAEQALAALRATAVPWATVIRDGQQQRIPARSGRPARRPGGEPCRHIQEPGNHRQPQLLHHPDGGRAQAAP